jgi:CubicO group peptidase (beta-lactamase class C family)
MSDAADSMTDNLRIFTGEPQYENFARMQQLNAVREMKPAQLPFQFPEGPRISLPTTYTFDGKTRNLHSLLGATHTSALLVLKDGVVRYEQYWLTGGRNVQWMSMSVAKSFVSALVGIALSEGAIGSLQDPIDRYVPKLSGSAYEGVSIKDVLQMSSGARWNEDYSDPTSEIFGLSAAMAPGGSLDDFIATIVRATTPGTLCMYNSADTQALAMLVAGATGRTLADYMQEKLCEPLGMESPGYWITDSVGREMAFAGLLLTARDFAKLGELYRNGGQWSRREVVASAYVAASIKADAPHLMPGKPMVGDHALGPGYGYQWWLPDGNLGEFSGIGVYNQYVYVDPSRGVVIVKLSANPAYGTTSLEENNKDNENIAALRTISRQID